MAAHVNYIQTSTTAFSFRNDEKEAIIRVIGYGREDHRRRGICFPAQEHTAILASLSTPFNRGSVPRLGVMDKMPAEILVKIILQLDIKSVFHLRQVNNAARDTVDSLREYQIITTHGLDVLCALMRTNLAENVSLARFYHSLCATRCVWCGGNAEFMFLLSWRRACFRCVAGSPIFQLRRVSVLRAKYSLTQAAIAQLRKIKPPPTLYGPSIVGTRSQANTLALLNETYTMFGTPSVWGTWPLSIIDQDLNYRGACVLPFFNRATGEAVHALSCAGCQLAKEKKQFPTMTDAKICNTTYTPARLLEHFRWCAQAQVLWVSSNGGTRVPSELPRTTRRRGYMLHASL